MAGALSARLESPALGTLSAGSEHLTEILNYAVKCENVCKGLRCR
jgi:hypothetical protein